VAPGPRFNPAEDADTVSFERAQRSY